MGTVYVLSNPSMPGLLKIGWTDRSPEERVTELSASTGVPTAFVLEYHALLEDAQSAERTIHARFNESRVNGSREFFSVSLDEVVAELKRLRVAQILRFIESLEREFSPHILSQLLRDDPTLLEDPLLQPGRLDATIASLLRWDDKSLMKIIDALLSKRAALRATFYLK